MPRDAESPIGPARWAPLALVCAAATAVVISLGVQLTFFNDDWYFLLQRPGLESHGGLDSVLAPHNGNLVALPAVAYKVLVAVFGLGSQAPFRILLAVAVCAVGVFLYLLVSERVGPVAGLAAAAVVVLLGPAWEDLLFFASIDLIGSLAAGLAALYLLERDTPRRNALGCALLTCAVLCSNAGLPFLVGGAIAILIRRRLGQLWVVAIPAVLFGLWWAFDGSEGPSYLRASNVKHLPRYVLDSASSGLASITGLNRGTVSGTYSRGHVLIAVAGVLTILWLARDRRPRPWLLVFSASAFTFWLLTGASFIPGREPFASRYQLIDAAFLLLIGAEALSGVRPTRPINALVLVAAAAVIWSNASDLRYGYRFLRNHGAYTKADLGALELARGVAAPSAWLTATVARDPYLSGVTAGRYYAETRAHGSPVTFTPIQIMRSPPGLRQAADSVLASAERIAPFPLPSGFARSTRACVSLALPGGSRRELAAAGRIVVVNRSGVPLVLGARRFAPTARPVYTGFLAGHAAAQITLPADRASLPWELVVRNARTSAATTAVCRT